MPTLEDLRYFQAMPLEVKIGLTRNRIREWVREYGESGVYVSFSGGKDSTVLLHIVREIYPDIEAVFVNTGLEYPEIQQFVKTFDNVTILRPKMPFNEVIKKYNIPIASVYGDVVYADDPDQIRFEDCGEEKLTTSGCKRTGCIFCGFGCHFDKGTSRFQMLKETHPKQYDYCLNGGEFADGVWQPNKQGLGMKHVFDELNKIYGEGFIKY